MQNVTANISVAESEVSLELMELGIDYHDYTIESTSIINDGIYHSVRSNFDIRDQIKNNTDKYSLYNTKGIDGDEDMGFHITIRASASDIDAGPVCAAGKHAYPDDVEELDADHDFVMALMDLVQSHESYDITERQALYAAKGIAEDKLLESAIEEL